VRVEYRDSWFYIDETDQPTKQVFRLTSALWAAGIAKATQQARRAPGADAAGQPLAARQTARARV